MGIYSNITDATLCTQLLDIVQNFISNTLSAALSTHRNSMYYGITIFIQPPLALYLVISWLQYHLILYLESDSHLATGRFPALETNFEHRQPAP